MRVLYYNPPCKGGIEQTGYIFLLLLKKLGHQVDFWNTQDANIQEKIISREIENKKYDLIVLNSAHSLICPRLIKKELDNLFIISHALQPSFPSFAKILTLNYLLQYKFLYYFNFSNVFFPLTYPYWWGFPPGKLRKKRKLFFVFIGRWHPSKFHPSIREFFKKNKIFIDLGILYHEEKNYSPDIFKKISHNQLIEKVYSFLSQATYILLPSTTECISLVIGEAIVNGCFPIVFETPEQVHQQFFVGYKLYSMEEFANLTLKIFQNQVLPPQEFYEKFVPFARDFWSIEKTLTELEIIFGKTGKKGKIIVKHTDVSFKNNLWYKNATIITKEKI